MQYREELTQIGKVVKLNESSVSVEWLIPALNIQRAGPVIILTGRLPLLWNKLLVIPPGATLSKLAREGDH